MTDPLVLVFDIGTQSTRAVLVSPDGTVVDREQRVYHPAYYSRQPNRAEQRPEFYYEHICAASRTLMERNPACRERLCACAITVFRDSVVCLDREGKPLTDCILWLDKREAKHLRPLPLGRRILFRLVGMGPSVDMLHRMSVCNWLAENEPELWGRTERYVMLSTYLQFRLTGHMADSEAAQMGHVPFDYKHRTWDKNGLSRCLYNVPNDKLCELVPGGTTLGPITAETAALGALPTGLPVIATGSDKGCETLGLGVLRPDEASLSFGTSATVQFATRRYFEPEPFLPSYPAIPHDLYNAEVQLYRGYWMLSWFKKNFASEVCDEAERLGCSAEELLNRHLDEVPPGCDGLMMLPHWAPGVSTPGARGAMIGFSDDHGKYHVYRAIIEGINFGLMEGLLRMQKRSGQRIRYLYVGGGGSRSDEICQITADMFGLPVRRIHTQDACSLGAAMCVMVSQGIWPDYETAVANMRRIDREFQPDAARHQIYERLYRTVYAQTYRTLAPLHRRLIALTERTGD